MMETALRELESRLDIPYPQRKELVQEIATHLADLFDALRCSGLSPAAAEAEALAKMSLDKDFINSIADIHRPAVARVLARLPRPISLGVEFTSIALFALIIISTILKEALVVQFFQNGGLFMYLLNVAGFIILWLSAERIYSLFIKKDHSAKNLERRTLSFRYLALACFLVGLIGTLLGFTHFFMAMEELAGHYPPEWNGMVPIYAVSRMSLSTTIWGTFLALLAVSVDFLIKAKRSRIERWLPSSPGA